MTNEALEQLLQDTMPGPERLKGFRLQCRAVVLYQPHLDERRVHSQWDTPLDRSFRVTMTVNERDELFERHAPAWCAQFWDAAVDMVNTKVRGTIFGQGVDWPVILFEIFDRANWAWPAQAQQGRGEDDMGASTPEGRVKAKLNRRLSQLNLIWKYMPVPSGYGMQSLDYLLCAGGHFVAIETKAPGKRPTPRQDTTIEAIRAAGGIVFVVDDDETMDACIGGIVILIGAGKS